MDKQRKPEYALSIALCIFAMAASILAGCKAKDERDQLLSIGGQRDDLAEYAMSKLDLESHRPYMIVYSSDPNHSELVAPVLLPVSRELEKMIRGSNAFVASGDKEIIFSDLANPGSFGKHQVTETETGPNKLSEGFLYVACLRNSATTVPPFETDVFSVQGLSEAMRHEKAEMTTDENGPPLLNWPELEWESGRLQTANGEGDSEYFYRRLFDDDHSLGGVPSELLMAVLEFPDYTVLVYFSGPWQLRTDAEARNSKRDLLQMLQGVEILPSR